MAVTVLWVAMSTIKKHEINLGQLASTKMMCQNTAELSSKFNEALNKVAGYQVYGQTLKLLDRHGNPVLQLRQTQTNRIDKKT